VRYESKKQDLPSGNLLGLFLLVIFSLRFLYEFIKEDQSSFEENMTLNMGQILSIPLVITGIVLLVKSRIKGINQL